MTHTITTATDVKAFSMEGVVKRYRGFTLGPLDLDLKPGAQKAPQNEREA